MSCDLLQYDAKILLCGSDLNNHCTILVSFDSQIIVFDSDEKWFIYLQSKK